MFALCCYAENAAGEVRATGINERRSGSAKGAGAEAIGSAKGAGAEAIGSAKGAGAKRHKKTGAPGRGIPV